MVLCSLKAKLWQPRKQRPRFQPPLWSALQQPALRTQFVDSVLAQLNDSTTYAEYVEHVHASANAILPKRKIRSPSCLWDDDEEIRRARLALTVARRSDPTSTHQDLEANLDSVYSRRRDEIISESAQKITRDHLTGKSGAVWKGIEKLTGRKIKPHAIVAANSMNNRLKIFHDHFCAILNHPASGEILAPLLESLPIAPGIDALPITEEEIIAACSNIQPGKAAGDDGIPTDVARLPEIATVVMLPIFNAILAEGEKPPDEFKLSIIATIPKKGNNTLVVNQRGIALMQTNAKLFNGVLLPRMRDRFEQLLLSYQAGFRPNRNTTEQILSLRIIIDTCLSRKKSLVIVFVDYSKAFDSVDRGALGNILALYGLPAPFVNVVMSMYTDTRAYVRCQSGKTPDFETTSGVLQGDTLAPYLFAICMDYVMRASLQDSDAYTVRRRMSSRYPAVKLPILAYADDAALLSDDASAAQSQLARFETVSKSVGLHLNATKTEVMYVGAEPVPIKSITGATLSTCSDFTYLGNAIANSHTGFKKRRQLAWVAARKLLIIWESSASDAVKIQLFTACVETVLLYSSEAWTITDQMKDAIDAAHRALLRYALNIRYPTRCSNLALQRRSLLPPATTTIRRKRLSLAGHFLRRPDTPLAVLLGLKNQPTEPYRRGGALRRTYVEQLREDLAAMSLSFERASAVAQSRPTWKRLTETVR